jgi:hypothetical protein
VSFIYHSRGQSDCPRSVFLAIPVGDGKPFVSHAVSLANAQLALHNAGWAVELAVEANNCHVDDTRNSLVREFLLTDCSEFVFIDADVSWRDEDLVKLMSYDRDIVAGIYPKKTDNTEFPVYLTKGELWAEADGLLEVERAPTGFLRIRRHVLEKLSAQATQYTSNGHKACDGTYPLLFERTNGFEDRRRWSGDYSFCNKAKAAGFRVFVDPEMVFGHAGTKVWTGCLGDHLRERAGLDHPEFVKAIASVRDGDVSLETLVPFYRHSGSQFAATVEMLAASYQMASRIRGNVLECGSGATTLILGLAAERFGGVVHSLEHDIEWYDLIRRRLDKNNISTVHLHYAPLRDGVDGCRWYEIPRNLPRFDLVVCDGPQRRFGRSGLQIRLGHLIQGAGIIIDDTDDPREMVLARRLAGRREVHNIEVRDAKGRQFSFIAPNVHGERAQKQLEFA